MIKVDYKNYIGKTFTAKGLVDTRKILIKEVYFLANRKKYPAFRCEIIGSMLNEKIGERENFLSRDIITNGKLCESIKVLTR